MGCIFLVVESVLVAEKNTFFARLSNGKICIILLRLASSKTHWDSGRRFLKNPVPEIISKLVFCPSPQSGLFFFWGRAVPSITMARPREVATLWPSQPLTLANPPGVWGLYWELIPIALCSHFPYVPISIRVPSMRQLTFYLFFFSLNSVPEISNFVSIDFVFSP